MWRGPPASCVAGAPAGRGWEAGPISERAGESKRRSGHLPPHRIPRVSPAPALHDRRHPVDADPDVLEAEIERGEAEADDVGRAEVADHAGGDQRLADFEGVGVAEGDVAAALLGQPRG